MKFVDLNAQHDALQPELDRAIAGVIRSSAFIQGPAVEEFEERFARLVGARHCISCANGTDAIYIALRALGLAQGDEVITTAHSWIATSETVTQAGGKVVFCDTEEKFFCLDAAGIEALVTPRTKGIIAVHLFGQPADMDPITDIAKRHGLWVIEDCAQAPLAEYRGRRAGSIGDVATYSFYPGKNLGAMGDAGCLATARADIAEFARAFARHGGKHDHLMEGINSRMDTLQAAVLNVKMDHLPHWNARRREISAAYDDALGGIAGVEIPRVRPGCVHAYHLYVVKCSNRDSLRRFLGAEGIPSLVNYPRPLPFYPAYAHLEHSEDDFPIASRHARRILSLPMHPYLPPSDVGRVADAVRAGVTAGPAR